MIQEKSQENSITLVYPNVVEAVSTMRAFQELKSKLLDENDVVQIEGKKYIKRSGWRKIALAFNISTEIVEVSREEKDGKYIVRVKARAKLYVKGFGEFKASVTLDCSTINIYVRDDWI
jgi:hypothetical protein